AAEGLSVLPVFFFQAEDGIRDFHVTGVQTCALPISACTARSCRREPCARCCRVPSPCCRALPKANGGCRTPPPRCRCGCSATSRSEERRVGKESGARRAPWRYIRRRESLGRVRRASV